MQKILNKLYPTRTPELSEINEIPRDVYGVYILTYNNKPIVVGHGKYNRAKVIFDDLSQITNGHIKAIFVRLYHLFGDGEFQRFFIECSDKAEAIKIESNLHKLVGGNSRKIPSDIRDRLFSEIPKGSVLEMLLKIALESAFDGIYDLRGWRKKGILNDETWEQISSKLRFDMLKNYNQKYR